MSRQEVEERLGPPLDIELDGFGRGDNIESLVYFRRRPMPIQYPMLWIHLRDGKVVEVYAKRHYTADSYGVYGLSVNHQWETRDFLTTFPSALFAIPAAD